MSKQRNMLPRLVSQIATQVSDPSILLTGSVQRGDETPCSDIDLVIVVSDVREAEPQGGKVAHSSAFVKVVETELDGVHVTFNFIGAGLLKDMEASPWKYYQFAKAETLHEGRADVEPARAAIRRWFDARPDVAELWMKQEADYEDWRYAKRIEKKDIPLRFAYSTDFAAYVDQKIKDEQQYAIGAAALQHDG